LNGEHLALHGVSRHQDRPVKGWAISRADQEQDFDLMQDMGVDAVRLAHYQHDQYSYELADRRGLVAWAEIPLVNKVSYDGSPAHPAFSANARQQLLELIRQNYNHPSIAVWSIANEVDLTPTQLKGPSRASPLLEALNELAHEEDPARATTLADCCEAGIVPQAGGVPQGGAPRDELFGITDVLGYNRYFGWYTGQFADFGAMLDAAHARHPTIPIAVSEYGAGAALTQHSDDPGGGPINPHGRPHPEEYQNLYHEESWPALNGRPYLWAAFIWNMFDFSSDSRREGDLTDINEKGMVSDDRQTRKDAFYYYRANWSAAPTLHLVGRRYANRDYGVFDVKAYSNAAAARLRLNDTDLGVATCTAGICLWPAVHLREGRNEVSASATIAGRETGDSLVWNLPHPATLVRIKAGDISGCTTGSGERFGSDVYFDGGRSGSINPPESAAAQRKTVSAPTPMLYDTYREGQFSYRVPLPNGRYRITLKFAEPAAAEVGARVFDVSANGAVALDNFDIFAAAGAALKGVDESFDARVSENALTLTFTPRRGQALVSALSIAPLDSF
jgi:beta-galactosidase